MQTVEQCVKKSNGLGDHPLPSSQELHLVPIPLTPETIPAVRPQPIPLRFAPFSLSEYLEGIQDPNGAESARAVLLEPFWNEQHQLRLFACFSEGIWPVINGEAASRLSLMAPGDEFSWSPGGLAFRVALYVRPLVGPPPKNVLGKPCPVCRVPFVPTTTCFTCGCGAVTHCEGPGVESLQCALLAPTCVVCRRAVVLVEGYEGGVGHDD